MAAHSDIGFEFAPSDPLLLHAPPLRRTDSNSPVLRRDGDALGFVSHYLPRGHTYRRFGETSLWPQGALEAVTILDDPAPEVGKWIQSVWRAPDDRLFGWYHAEERVPAAKPLFLPHIGALQSEDDGRSWRLIGEVLRVPFAEADCSYQNGFLTGGYGDFCVVPDRQGDWFYLHYSAYVPDERYQGIAVLRYPVAARERPVDLEVWRDGCWQPMMARQDGTPIFGVNRGWRHRDPAAWWGPAIHYNRDLQTFVMLLNRTENGNADIVQRGVFISFNDDLGCPAAWSTPHQIVDGGSWYPQAIGLGSGDGDTLAGAEARFFMSGFSAWSIRFRRGGGQPASTPLVVTRDTFLERFGQAPW